MSSFDSSTHRLAGSGNEAGGLIVRKKKKEEGEFKKPAAPRGSLLGLDVLARRKREQKEELGLVEKKPRLEGEEGGERSSYDNSDIRISFGKSDHSKVNHASWRSLA